ncbi:MAG: hypothetical protein IJI84_06325 [Clostridia bacterium]|nr:hypothetical protein [Clostridia bacterium]
MVDFLRTICKFNFGEFEKEEFKKFLKMGGILMMILGVYWTLRPLKDSLFDQIIGADHRPYAKIISALLMIPFVALYTKILDYIPKSKLISKLPPLFYGSIVSVYAVFVWFFQNGTITKSIFTTVLGYFWYFCVESYGSLVLALFWSFATDITTSEDANKGFSLVYALGHLGGILFPILFIGLPIGLGVKSDSVSMILAAILMLFIAPILKSLITKTPKELMVPQNSNKEAKRKKEKTGFMEGVKILFSHKYLISIFAVNFFFELIVTLFDFNFKIKASKVFTGVELTRYYFKYSSIVNLITFIFLLFGISKITEYLGLKVSLAMVPILFCVALIGFFTVRKLEFLFWLMVCSKAINYSVNGPSLKQLYIPTSPAARSKAQAWIETFGGRFSKMAGSGLNALPKIVGKAAYRLVSGSVGFTFIIIWFCLALYLGKTHKKAIDSKTNIC